MTDLHIHTTLSHDGREEIENYIKEGIKNGDTKIGFSEHIDVSYGKTGTKFNEETLKETQNITLQLKEKYLDKIEILFGIEFGYTEEFKKTLSVIEKNYQFDYIINSIHRIPEYGGFYHGTVFNKLNKKEAYGKYLETVLNSVNADYDFQILGHLGYAARYSTYEDKLIDLKNYSSLYTEILKTIIKKGVALELNTAVKTLPTIVLPHKEIIEKYLSLGGKMFTFGSDAHDLLRFHENEDKVKELLLSYGVKETYYFKNRKPIQEKL